MSIFAYFFLILSFFPNYGNLIIYIDYKYKANNCNGTYEYPYNNFSVPLQLINTNQVGTVIFKNSLKVENSIEMINLSNFLIFEYFYFINFVEFLFF